MERKPVKKLRRTSPDFNLPIQQKQIRKKQLYEAGIPMLRESKACFHIKYKQIHYVYKYKELKVHNRSSDHDRTSTCLNIRYKKMLNEVER